jgi:hypothetical protein
MKRKLRIKKPNSQSFKILVFILFIIVEFAVVLSLVRLPYLGVVFFFIGIIGLFFIFIKEKREKRKNRRGNLLAQLILNLKGEAGSWVGILTVIFVVVNINILSDLIWETRGSFNSFDFENYFIQIKTGQFHFWALNNWGIFITQILLIGCFLVIPFYIFPVIDARENNNPRVLISALSLLIDFGKQPTDKESVKKKLMSLNSAIAYDDSFYNSSPRIATPKEFEYFNFDHSAINWGKWNVIRHSLIAHEKIEKIILVASSEILLLKDTINFLINEDTTGYFLNFDLEKLIQTYYPDRKIKVVYSNAMEFNDFYDVKSKLQTSIVEHAIDKGYSDADLLFNITAGTSQVTAAMILSALKGERKAEYISQNTSEIVPVDIDVLTIQDLWEEIGLRVMKNRL